MNEIDDPLGDMSHSDMSHSDMNHSDMNHSDMNHSDMNTDDATWDDNQWCQWYLLGELTPDQQARFEQRLGDSADLADQLLSHSNLLLAIAPEQGEVIPCTHLVTRSPIPPTSPRHNTTLAIVAVAASLLLVVTARWYQQTRTSEDLLIARAWVETLTSDPSDRGDFSDLDHPSDLDHSSDLGDPDDIDGSEEAAIVMADENLPGTDAEHFDWMFVAVSIDHSLTMPTPPTSATPATPAENNLTAPTQDRIQ